MFVWSKGKPKTCNYIRVPTKTAGRPFGSAPQRREDGSKRIDRDDKLTHAVVKDMKVKSNLWEYSIGSGVSTDKEAFAHPAIFPEQLANDHIVSWSNENELVYDPFMGSGTTAKMALLNSRNVIGSEMSEEYCVIALKRIAKLSKKIS